jgi:hypothetical protein
MASPCFLRQIHDLQTFTNFCFPEAITLAEYDRLLVCGEFLTIKAISASKLPVILLFFVRWLGNMK